VTIVDSGHADETLAPKGSAMTEAVELVLADGDKHSGGGGGGVLLLLLVLLLAWFLVRR
jgi:hypothetical protein